MQSTYIDKIKIIFLNDCFNLSKYDFDLEGFQD